MSMYDEYIPDPPVNCPHCGNILGGGPNDWISSALTDCQQAPGFSVLSCAG
jgi:hypothetical protein